MAQDGLAAAAVGGGKLGGGLFAWCVGLPNLLRIEPSAAVKLSIAFAAFIALAAIAATVLFDLFWAAEKAFLCSKPLILFKAL